jgi:hypothetical protein
MKNFLVMILLLAGVSLPHHALAQQANCGAAVDTGGGQCIPMDAPGMPGYQGNQNRQPAQPQQPRAVWADRWGAIAEDPQASAVGTVVQQESESKAEAAALSVCTQHGGGNCKIALTYYNQCAAVAVDEQNLAVHARAPTKEKAEQVALDGFGKGHITKIVYSACSLPVRVQ